MRSAAVHNALPMPLLKLRLPETGSLLVAVSGGLDSMALLNMLNQLSPTQGWKLTVAHFNHHLRGRASDADEALVRKTAEKMSLPLVAGGADVKRIAGQEKLSVEMAARKLRHEFLARAARERKIKMVALAHHANDQVELFFLRLLRGAGGGLGGMKWRSPSPSDRKISLVRPLLDISRAELEEFTRENKIVYREDATNSSLDFLRNRVRHELLPLLRKHYQPGLNKAVLRLMEIIGAEADLAGEMARSWLGGRAGDSSQIRGDFEKVPVAVQRQVLKLQLGEHAVTADFDLIESLRGLANQSISAGAGVSVLRDAQGLVNVKEHHEAEFDENELTVRLDTPGGANFDGVRLKWELGARLKNVAPPGPSEKSGTEFFDADKIGNEIVLRHWRSGDRFQPIGLKGATKLQDLFTNNKIPRQRRHELILGEAGGEIFWVEGLRISEKFKLTSKTKQVLVWNWKG